MRSRGISEAEVEAVVSNPDNRRPAGPLADDRPAEILSKNVGERLVRVYVEIGRTPTFVKTVASRRRRQ
jgi:hypothetical protein